MARQLLRILNLAITWIVLSAIAEAYTGIKLEGFMGVVREMPALIVGFMLCIFTAPEIDKKPR